MIDLVMGWEGWEGMGSIVQVERLHLGQVKEYIFLGDGGGWGQDERMDPCSALKGETVPDSLPAQGLKHTAVPEVS